MIHIYTGDGKGKTTAAVGLAVRAAGWGWPVYLVYFFKKNAESGEEKALRHLKTVTTRRLNLTHPFFLPKASRKNSRQAAAKETIKKELKSIAAAIKSKKYRLVILDELNNAVRCGFVEEKNICSLLKTTPSSVELILTGRGASKELMAQADYVSEIRCIKHPFQKGISAREGIEF